MPSIIIHAERLYECSVVIIFASIAIKMESNCSAIGNVIFVTIYYICFNKRLPFSLIVTSLGPITSTLVILHLCLLKCKKCKKKQRDRKRKKGQYGPLEYTYTGAIINEIYTVNERNDVFTSYIASINARTKYRFDRGSTITESLP